MRDLLLGHTAHDIDFATTATPDVMLQLLNTAGIHVVETGARTSVDLNTRFTELVSMVVYIPGSLELSAP